MIALTPEAVVTKDVEVEEAILLVVLKDFHMQESVTPSKAVDILKCSNAPGSTSPIPNECMLKVPLHQK